MFRRAAYLLLCLPFTLVGQPKKPDASSPAARFGAYVQQAVRDWHVPGLTVTVVKEGQVLFKQGYGVRDVSIGASAPVNTQTLFAMASTTKAMTAACLGMLVDEGKLRWDDPVQTYLPDFQLYDPYATRELRVRDLLTHSAGLGNADFLWGAIQLSSDEILRRMRYVKPAYSFRSSFIYQNIMYLAAGKVIEKVSGQPWGTFMQQRLFGPLGMTRTRAYFRDVTDPNRAKPHWLKNDTVRLMDARTEEGLVDAIGPAGSVWSCADDLANWMRCMLDSGRISPTQRLLKPATWAEMTKPQVLVPDGQFYPTQRLTKPVWKSYGLGWYMHDYRGYRVNFHTGSLLGMIALHAQLPDYKLAVYIQGNLDHAELRHALMYRAFDEFALDVPKPAGRGTNASAPALRDWSAELLTLYGTIQKQAEQSDRRADSARVLSTKPSLPLTAYVGAYTDPLYGRADVTMQDGALRILINKLYVARLDHWHFDTFRAVYEQFWNRPNPVIFTLGPDGKVAGLNWVGFSFEKEVKPAGSGD